MYSKKIFPTTCMGFSKNAVLDYIYEQDKIAEERQEALQLEIDELHKEILELEENKRERKSTIEFDFPKENESEEDIASLKAKVYQLESANKILNSNLKENIKTNNENLNKIVELEKQLAKMRKCYDENKFVNAILEKDKLIENLKNQIKNLKNEEVDEISQNTLELKNMEIKHLKAKNEELQRFLDIMQGNLDDLESYTQKPKDNK